MIRLLWALSARTRYYLRCYTPTNIALDAIRTRRGLKWGVPAMLLAVPYLLIARFCVAVIEGGGPGWLNILVLLYSWNVLKFLSMGPVSLLRLFRARAHEAATRRRQGNYGEGERVIRPHDGGSSLATITISA